MGKNKHGRVGVKASEDSSKKGFKRGLAAGEEAERAFLLELMEISTAKDIKKAISARLAPTLA